MGCWAGVFVVAMLARFATLLKKVVGCHPVVQCSTSTGLWCFPCLCVVVCTGGGGVGGVGLGAMRWCRRKSLMKSSAVVVAGGGGCGIAPV